MVGGRAEVRIARCTIVGGPWPLLQSPAVAVRELSTLPTRLASPSTPDWRSERARWNRLFCLWFLRYRSPWSPCALPTMAAGALSSVGHGGAGGAAVPHSASTAAARRDSRGGPEPGGYSWARGEALEPSRCLVRPRQPDPPGPVAPSEAQPRVSRTPVGSPGSQSRAGDRCAVGRRCRCPHLRPDPGAGCRLRHSSLPPTPVCSPRPLSCSLGHVWARPTPTHSGHLSCLSLSLACPQPVG